MSQLKDEHDRLLSEKPDGVEHDTASCVFCTANISDPQEGGEMTYSKDDLETAVQAAVAEATSPLLAELETLRASRAEDEVEARIAEAVSEKDTEIANLKVEVDTVTLRATEAEKALSDLTELLESAAAEAAEAAARDERKAERVAQVKEVASFEEKYVEENADRWADMDQAMFDVMIDGFRAIPRAATASEGLTEVPAETAMTGARGDRKSGSAVADVFELLRSPYDS